MREWEDGQGSGIQVEGALVAGGGVEGVAVVLGLRPYFDHRGIIARIRVVGLEEGASEVARDLLPELVRYIVWGDQCSVHSAQPRQVLPLRGVHEPEGVVNEARGRGPHGGPEVLLLLSR